MKTAILIFQILFLFCNTCKEEKQEPNKHILIELDEEITFSIDEQLSAKQLKKKKEMEENILPLAKKFKEAIINQNLTEYEKLLCYGLNFEEYRDRLIKEYPKWSYLMNEKELERFKIEYSFGRVRPEMDYLPTSDPLFPFRHAKLFKKKIVKIIISEYEFNLEPVYRNDFEGLDFTISSNDRWFLASIHEGVEIRVKEINGKYCLHIYFPNNE